MEEVVTLNQVAQKRLMLLGEVMAGRLTLRQAAQSTGRSIRQVKRWLVAWRKRGAAGIAHGNRGRSPANQLPKQVTDKVRSLAAGPYAGLNICHLTDLLAEREGIVLSRSTVRRIARAGAATPAWRWKCAGTWKKGS